MMFAIIIIVVTACNTAYDGNNDDGEGSEIGEVFGDTAVSVEGADEDRTDELISIDPELESGHENTGSENDDQAKVDEVVTEPVKREERRLAIDVDSESIDTDANGVTIGFTADGHPFRGDPDAPVLINEFSDYQCPYCARFVSETLTELENNQLNNGEAVLVYYDFPLVNIHPQAKAAANAARCAGEQGAAGYWSMHDALFVDPGEWSNQNHDNAFMRYAENIGLKLAEFNTCISENRYEAEIESDLAEGSALGITGTPTFVMNDQMLVGAQPTSIFNAAISALSEGGSLNVAGSVPAPAQAPSQPSAAPTPAAISSQYAGALGDPNAPVTIVEFTDYQCPYCSRHSLETMPQIVRDMVDTGRVYYILKDFPLDQIHADARMASKASRCAKDQDSYWEMHDMLFAGQEEWAGKGQAAGEVFSGYASNLGLDAEAFASCLSSDLHDEDIEANVQEGRSLGVSGTPFFFVDGYPLNGARPFDHFVAAVSLAEQGRLAEAFAPPEQAAPSQTEIDIENSFSIGDPDAPVTIIEYTDFQCPYCSRHYQQTYPHIVEQYVETGAVRYVFKDFPLTQIHPQATKAAEAARCALDQDAFLEMHDILFDRQQDWSGTNPNAIFTGYANELGLNEDEFSECLDSNQYEAAVLADLQEGVGFGVTGTPSFFINGYALTGAQPLSVFQEAIESLLEN
jgi:protein-disulfide isomerase